MNKKGFLIVRNKQRHAIVRKSCKKLRLLYYNSRELATVIESICAYETKIPPFVIFRGSIRRIGNLIYSKKEGKTVLA